MTVTRLTVVKYVVFGCAAVGLLGWNIHLQKDIHDERSKLSDEVRKFVFDGILLVHLF